MKSRRRWFVVVGLLCSVPLLDARSTVAQDAAASADAAAFRFQEIDGNSLGLWQSDRPVFVYNHGRQSLPDVPAAGDRSSYLHPIYGLDGEVITDDFPADHYHHHGLFWGWPHVRIAGRDYDLWKMRGIRIEFQRWLAREAGADGAKLGVENAWVVGGRPVMKEEAWFEVHPADDGGRSIDITLKWTPLEEDITLGGAEGKSYGGLSLRFAPRADTVITAPDGRTDDDLLIARLPWAALSGRFEGAAGVSGAALFIHSHHPDYPPEWMTRHYGLLAVGWPGVREQTLRAGVPITCRYRLWIFRGSPDATEIDAVYEAYRVSGLVVESVLGRATDE